jgi:hypothetical protein
VRRRSRGRAGTCSWIRTRDVPSCHPILRRDRSISLPRQTLRRAGRGQDTRDELGESGFSNWRSVHGTPGQVAGIPGLKSETWGTLRFVAVTLQDKLPGRMSSPRHGLRRWVRYQPVPVTMLVSENPGEQMASNRLKFQHVFILHSLACCTRQLTVDPLERFSEAESSVKRAPSLSRIHATIQ